jgi:predicted RNase H-like nuclease (RuvC/YqgF family)
MASAVEPNPSQPQAVDGNAEVERLTTLVQQLQDECVQLRQALAEAEAERQLFRQAYYDKLRAEREFEDVDIASLTAMSAGPVGILAWRNPS